MDWETTHASSPAVLLLRPYLLCWCSDGMCGFHTLSSCDLDPGPAESKVCLSINWASQLLSIPDNPRAVSTQFLINPFPLSFSLHHLWLVQQSESLLNSFLTLIALILFERNSSHYALSIIYILIITPNSCPPLWNGSAIIPSAMPPFPERLILQGRSKWKHSQKTTKDFCLSSAGHENPKGSPRNVCFLVNLMDNFKTYYTITRK